MPGRLMQRPGTILPEDKLLAVLFGDDVAENSAAILKGRLEVPPGLLFLGDGFIGGPRVRLRSPGTTP